MRIGVILRSALAGVCIGIGATAYLLCDNRMFGAVAFSVGLLMVRAFALPLYTGLVSYAPFRGRRAIAQLPAVWVGNVCGASLAALALRHTSIGPKLYDAAKSIVVAKLQAGPLSWFLLAAFCNVLIYFAVEKKNDLHTVFGVTVFVLCGFEHCIADAFYITLAHEAFSFEAIPFLFVVTAGNTVGGITAHLLRGGENEKQS